jgi:hypothetical protein
MPQEFVSTQRFEDHIKECDEKTSDISTSIKEIRLEMKNFVTQKDLQWALGLSMSALFIILGWIINLNYRMDTKIDKQNEAVSTINVSVGKIQEKIEPLDFELKK